MRLRLLILALALASAAPGALAFTDDGHRLVAQVAEVFLTPAARARIALLLEADEKYDNQCPTRTFEDTAVWADCIKHVGAYAAKYPHSDLWHYDDVPLCGPADRAAYCPDGNCLSGQFDRFTAILGDKGARVEDRLDALRFLVHLVGDAHQPLHAEDNGDTGGNDVPVLLPAAKDPIKLHLVWDLSLVLAFVQRSPHPLADLVLGIGPADVQAWSSGTIGDWLAESHEIARTLAYGELPGGLVCARTAPGKKKPADKPKPLVLSEDYVKHGSAQDFVRIQQAGVRLAWVLNRALQ